MEKDKDKIIGLFVSEEIAVLSLDTSSAKIEKATWRHAFARKVCEDLKAWSLLVRDMPEDMAAKGGTPSYAENAAYMAISSYAACGAQNEGVTLGEAVASLGETSRDRFTRLERSRTVSELWRNLKPLMRLIGSKKGIGIDYSLLAKDLMRWQSDPIEAIRKWERDYYSKAK